MDNKEIELRDMDDDDDEVVNVDALAKFAEEQKRIRRTKKLQSLKQSTTQMKL
jgi:DNA-directed RNA polymerase subunit beta